MVIICLNSYEKLTKIKIEIWLESVRAFLKITLLVSRKSYLVIICPNSHEKFKKIQIRSS